MPPEAVNVLFVMPTISIVFHLLLHVNARGRQVGEVTANVSDQRQNKGRMQSSCSQ